MNLKKASENITAALAELEPAKGEEANAALGLAVTELRAAQRIVDAQAAKPAPKAEAKPSAN